MSLKSVLVILTSIVVSGVIRSTNAWFLDFAYDVIFAVLRLPRSPAGRLALVWPFSQLAGIPRIYDSSVVMSRTDYSYMARIEAWHLGRLGPMLCGGAVIHPLWVLTSARCVVDENTGLEARTLDVVVGDIDIRLREGTEQARTGTAFVHPLFDRSTLEYDVALIRLNASIRDVAAATDVGSNGAETTVSVISVSKNPELDTTVGARVEIVGWGQVAASGTPFMPVGLRAAEVLIYDNRKCQDEWFGVEVKNRTRLIPEVNEKNLCVKAEKPEDESAGFCIGDIGGPVVATRNGRKYLVGVQSFMKVVTLERKGLPLPVDRCSMTYPNVATRVRAVVESFIKPTIDANTP